MGLDFRNINTVWSSLIVDTFAKLGLENAIICPGSRSTPLTIAFAQHPTIKTIPILDERSGSFFALGMAKSSHKPVVLVCTSGTAGANFFPAIIEAKYSHIPLIILTGDRPPELRECHAGQTINQVNLYGNYPQWQTELSLPSTDLERLFYLRQNIIHGWEKSIYPTGGIVHFNIPFREPLAPTKQLNYTQQEIENINHILAESTFKMSPLKINYDGNYQEIISQWQQYQKGIIIAGVDCPDNPSLYTSAIALLAQQLKFPILAEALSPIRNHYPSHSNLICTYDTILRNQENREKLKPEIIILIGEYPTSKELRKWLTENKTLTYIITPTLDNLDALHSHTQHLRINIINLVKNIQEKPTHKDTKKNEIYLKQWLNINEKIQNKIDHIMDNHQELFEGKISWLLSKNLPPHIPIFIANSMSVRYAEYFWQPNQNPREIYFSRGANGIDGTLSTALGIAQEKHQAVLLTGDLALLHDTNGFLINQHLSGSLTIILVNNHGGGIFEMLPIAEFNNIFEEYFATPQNIDFKHLTQTYNVKYKLIENWQELINNIKNLSSQGITLLEIKTNRKYDSWWLKNQLPNLSKS
ncbi:2-succinyl-5-enolpyruvyl-6-hydroxy-3-cyclohexene-1-carboxylic-acid synthase [Cyanobacterium stanieri LEGE 03274]|uniref:2-succinyl-5-enolpyruvyl-6-hydroxy-3-cyclohexene-1-carboxylate synthase n=1 Tax=Cyanobacterium stanieri LEGE 03274 TaxID=1828756 RepID=A0ABR9V7E9_9CHRO|nr:2-succinyl-5-enolpyruvyl-6-hydroxy-3-cyclohexene-1-carboxylic-acid synthase [Cyanobacterium stanieri]MBE9222754.1 2-succinyl-5-enolpyruvyl-6-hydroxy-3-cyclohexene-1-carboxylic-acid synthase [Cyanobacterium stanieri LEGE 03274]